MSSDSPSKTYWTFSYSPHVVYTYRTKPARKIHKCSLQYCIVHSAITKSFKAIIAIARLSNLEQLTADAQNSLEKHTRTEYLTVNLNTELHVRSIRTTYKWWHLWGMSIALM